MQKFQAKGNDVLADRWINGLHGDKLRPVAKALRRVIAATTYSGESSSTFFTAWKESIYSTTPLFDIPPGPTHVQTAVWFLEGKAKDWWLRQCVRTK